MRAPARSSVHRDTGVWLSDPEEGIDAWNERHVAGRRGEALAATLARYDAAARPLLERPSDR